MILLSRASFLLIKAQQYGVVSSIVRFEMLVRCGEQGVEDDER